MAIAPTALAGAGDQSNASSYATASITPTANCLIEATITNRRASAVATPTLSGNGLTWVQVDTVDVTAAGVARITVFRAMGASPSAGVVTIDFGGSTQINCCHSIVEYAGVDTSGTNGSGAVVQSKTATGTGTVGTADFDAAFGDAVNNATSDAIMFLTGGGATVAPEAGFTELHDVNAATENNRLQTAWRLGEDQTPAPTSSASVGWGQIVLEIKAAGGAATVTPAVIAVTAALPTPTVLAAATVAPAVIPASASLPTPTILAAANPTPAVIAAVAALPTPSILAAAKVTPTVIAATVTLPTPTIDVASGATTVNPAVIAATVALPTPTVLVQGADQTVTPATIAATAALPTPTILAAVTVTPSTIAVLVGLPTPTVIGETTVMPATIAITVTFPGPTIIIGAMTFWTPNPAGYDPVLAGDTPPAW